MHPFNLKEKVRVLRSRGKTYSEINKKLKVNLSKSTIAKWCRDIKLPPSYENKIRKLNLINFHKMRQVFDTNRKAKRRNFLEGVEKQNKKLFKLYERNIDANKLTLAILYLAEGSKTPRGSLMFGNSDPLVIKLFVNLMRKCYKIDESKFRCTVQCRADQNIKELELFWSKVTNISLVQFYKARVDKRTVGQISRKQDYKGVCRIDYFSSAIDLELKYIVQKIMLR